jgi:hypothetical protein
MPPDDTVWSLTSINGNSPFEFAATSDGVYRSFDWGSTWSPVNDGINGVTLRVFSDPSNPAIYYVTTASDGVFRTNDLGLTPWTQINGETPGTELGNLTVRGLDIKSDGLTKETRLYVGTNDGMWVGTTSNNLVPGPVTWRHVSDDGLNGHTYFWTLVDYGLGVGTFFAGTEGDGGFEMTLVPPANLTVPTVTPSSNLHVGNTLTADPGTWDGTQTISFDYQWRRCVDAAGNNCSDINDATESTYVLDSNDQNSYIRVKVTAHNDFPTHGFDTATSATTALVGSEPGSVAGDLQHPAPSIDSQQYPTVGDTISVIPSTFNPLATSNTFQWYLCDGTGQNCVPIVGATASTYKLLPSEETLTLAVSQTGSNANGSTTTALSGATNNIFPPQAAPVHAPSIAGAPYVGYSLTGNIGEWNYPLASVSRQWMQCNSTGSDCTTITDATGAVYRPTADDIGYRLRLDVVADTNGPNVLPDPNDPPASSALTAVVRVAPDVIAPIIYSAKLVPAVVKHGKTMTLHYTVSESCTFTIKLYHGKKVVGTLTLKKRVGTGTAKILTKVGKKLLPVGSYKMVITPTDPSHNKGKAKTLAFKIKK